MKWFRFILSNSLFIACCAVAMAFQTAHLFKLDISVCFYSFIFFSTLSAYSFYWLLSSYTFDNNFQVGTFFKKKVLNILVLFLAATGVIFSMYCKPDLFYYAIPAFAFSFLYLLPLFPFHFSHFTKRLGILKTLLLAFTWMYVTAFMPIQKPFWHLTSLHYLMLTNRFLFLLLLCIIFDSRDRDIDKLRGFHSLATDLKPNLLRYLVWVIFVLLFVVNLLLAKNGITLFQSIALQITLITTMIAYRISAKQQGYFFYYFLVDGLMIFSALSTFIASI